MKRLLQDRKTLYLVLTIMIVSVFTLSIAYAAMSAVLEIYGNSEVVAPRWVYATSYWSGSAYSSNRVWCVGSYADFFSNDYSVNHNRGCRPVITISRSLF